MTDALPELLTVNEAAAFLRMSSHALRCALSRGIVPGSIKIGRRRLFRRDALRAFVGLLSSTSPIVPITAR